LSEFIPLLGLLWLYLSEASSRSLHMCHWGGERRDRAVSCVLYGQGWEMHAITDSFLKNAVQTPAMFN